jgi:hypothetical protein
MKSIQSGKGWNGKKNGELLALMIEDKFDVLFTFDQNLPHQQNFDKYPIAILVLIAENNTYPVLTLLSLKIKRELQKPLSKGSVKVSA